MSSTQQPGDGRAAVVTGASRGIGAAVAQRLAHDGLAVVVNFAGEADAAGEVARCIEQRGGRAVAVRGDVSDPAGVRRLFDRHVAVSLKGTFNTLREAGRRLRDGGRVVNVSSSVVGTRPETYGVYAATKAAVEALTAILWINGQVLRANGGMV